MAPPLIQLKDISLTFGGTPLLSGVELSVSAGERVCLIGRNGSGKSTLLRIAAGLVEPDSGSRFVQPGATIRYLPQEPDFGEHKTTLAYVEAGLGPGDDHYQARYLLEQLGLTGEEDPAHVSGGEARRAALARVLAPSPDILLLDEPTNHLDLPTIEWLEGELESRRCALVLISHDRRFLTNLSRTTAWLDRGQIRQIERGFGAFEAWRDEVLAEEEREQHKLDRKIVNEEHWLRYGVSGRRKRNVKRLGNLFALRDQRRDYRGATGNATLAAAEAEKSGRLVIEAKTITKAYGERTIVDTFSTRIQRGDRVGIVGPNGAGKTTLVHLLIGNDPPDSGSVRLGANIEMATLDQHRESLDPKLTLAEALTGGRGDHVMVGDKSKHVIGYMKDFLFAQEQRGTPLEALSGGERGRLMLARALAKPSNLLILDEPTNDLDLETLDVLEDMLGDYDGTVILISHDRDFLDRVVTSVIVPEGQGRWIEYAGGYSDMLAQRGADVKRETVKADAAIEEKKEARAAAPEAAPRRRLSFNEKHALETLPKTIDRLHAEIAKQQKLLDDPDLYAKDRKTFDAASAAIAKAQDELATAEDRWLELEVLREEIEQA
ncbi:MULTISPECIES: ABC-F family ATP-binding cassette domain-containing protein [unclassified Bradyrhizobium]|uniref:ABC-F family ATP-binding cassette domain-containing protein n=1 Tax=unclassified Bradyrhizobium TaxID=2631580 RepID=UPI001BA922C0|nr:MULTISPECIES: ABC-F family ATP-binding cassette domain-containing protein [unclassified Bradyrhizobium]MBR1205789.1 ABC-F family ATP-binding cassette domain-containing protein [Bradyrhizobium sp. AUGA SZCCT0124]MBR1315822.1 ABC-F family ATP-binding cassette domain-containing protein [Bradyrhizobium sp. AUGA SZCCT0051]MBR1338116.1 ABC-F family ATP-binding cassette domain-containing protein [Bradyrhizobium sp. AUGA SZCCT0105]MBR1355771.1 ABC-F family ATP-binding cassette domain-containing prot